MHAHRARVTSLIIDRMRNAKHRSRQLPPAATGETAKRFPTAGGAGAFADFIVDELVPHIRSKYRTLPTIILAGHSFGGLFALELVARKPGAFSGVIAIS